MEQKNKKMHKVAKKKKERVREKEKTELNIFKLKLIF
jgi:hypothetical protein